jgi:hypothetical protein
LSQGLQYLFVGFALAYWIASFVMTMSSKGLSSTIARAEAGEAGSRVGSGAYFYQQLRFRYNPGAPKAIIIALLSVAVVGFFVVYVVMNSLAIVVLVAVQGYIVYASVDSFEALFFSRFLARAPKEQVGRWELKEARWAVNELNQGRLAFLLLGSVMFLLSFVASQLIAVIEVLIAYYVAAVLAVSNIVPLPAGASVVLVVVIYVISGLGIVWLGRKGLNVIRRRRTGHLQEPLQS